jgi:patatin-like phospholipase/acyl hydrolase
MPVGVLTCDGGGLKGVLTAALIERLEAEAPFLAGVQLFAGTSTGGIIALALAAGLPPSTCAKLYREHGATIFASRGLMDEALGGLDELWRANYAQDGLREVLEDTFKQKRLGDLKKDVLIPAFDLKLWRPKFFDRQHDGNELIVDVALATSAAPTYLPVYRGFCDGGVFANNPSDSALSYLVGKGVQAADVRLLSVGTGYHQDWCADELAGDSREPVDWGYRQWLIQEPHRLLQVLFDGSVLASHERVRRGMGPNYHRIQPILPGPVAMDDVSKIPLLELAAAGYDLDEAATWVKLHWST